MLTQLSSKDPKYSTVMGVFSEGFNGRECKHEASTGIIDLLEKLDDGKSATLIVGFDNDAADDIVSIMKEAGITITNREVLQSACFAMRPEEFFSRLRVPYDYKREILLEFWRLRGQLDSEKAIYRLSVIGVVESYETDYNAKCFKLVIRKRSNGEYISFLQKYLERYISTHRAEIIISPLKNAETLKECIYSSIRTLVNFIYSEIGEKRRNAIFAMRKACEEGIRGNGELAFRTYVDTYFNSKYYQDLVFETDSGKNSSIEIIYKYINHSHDNKDSLMHLRGACVNLLQQSPGNITFLILYAHSVLGLDPESSESDARDHINRAFTVLREEFSDAGSIDFLTPVLNVAREKNMHLYQQLTPFLKLLHLNKINDRLNQFIGGDASQ
jgi:ATP-dependent DNA helicase RecQ